MSIVVDMLDYTTLNKLNNVFQKLYKQTKNYNVAEYSATYYAIHKNDPEYKLMKNTKALAFYYENRVNTPRIVLTQEEKKQHQKEANKRSYDKKKLLRV